MAEQGGEKPVRTHLDEVAAMREAKYVQALEERLARREAFLKDPNRPAIANQNDRIQLQGLPQRIPEVDKLLDKLLLPRPETLLAKLKRKANERGEKSAADAQPVQAKTSERTRSKDKERW